MGVHGLLGFAKPAASRYVDLRYGQGGRIIADGHYLLHKFFYREGCALALVMGDDVKPLAREIVNHVTAFTNARWNVTIVFDGSSPPAKRRTATSRAKKRDAAREKCLAAAAMGDLDSASNHAKQAPSFSARVVARVSSIVMHETLAETTTAPFEADGQLKAMEDFYADGGERCLVYGTDSDLLVLGARSVLWEVSSPGGILGGQVIYTDNILRPSPSVFTGGSAGRFMRMLHGVGPEGELQKESPSLPSAGIVVERLLDFSCLAGNDYLKISGIGPATAIDIALAGDVVPDNEDTHSRDARMTDLAQKVVARFPASGSVQDVRQDISIARDMFEHQVVWMPETGKHAHLSGTATSEVLQVATGARFVSEH